MRLCALSIDLDEIHHYRAIHGLAPSAASEHAVYELALPRALAFAREHGLPLTLFAVASDLSWAQNRESLLSALALGHEIGNHSRDHLYDLVRRSAAEQRDQVAGALDAFQRELGVRPQGFRAPGYTLSDGLLQIVAEAGHRYDSSLFPCPPYYAAKAVVLGVQRLLGRRSSSLLDRPGVLRAPRRPYRVGTPYTAAGDGLLELPIQVTRGPGLPYIGTALALAGEWGARALTRLVVGEPFINLELHGIDFLDATDGLGALAALQPDLRVAAARKRRIFAATIERLRSAGYQFRTLAEVAAAVQRPKN